jgi:uncharacterized protein
MEYIIISSAALLGAFLTFFCGFGLGTIMLPVMALFFPLHLAIIATAFVHFGNNLFKVGLLFKGINVKIVTQFGIPAIVFAAIGAFLMEKTKGFDRVLHSYHIASTTFEISTFSVLIGLIIILFAVLELYDFLKFSGKNNKIQHYIGGALSGFFGGFSGHQGALRSAFLIKANVDKTIFLATSACIGMCIDFTRIVTYMMYESKSIMLLNDKVYLLITAVFFALLGSFFGNKLLKKQTITSLKNAVGIGLFVLGSLILFGIISR